MKYLILLIRKFILTIKGFLKLASLINRLNKPLSPALLDKLAQIGPLPNVEFDTPINLSPSNVEQVLNPYWISGFATGEACFTYFTKTRVNSAGKTVKDYSLVFEISQRTQDLHILNLIAFYFKTGNVYTDTSRISRYRLRTKDQVVSTLIPHFNNYTLAGYKALRCSVWFKVVCLLNHQVRTEQRDAELAN